ncbi:hypothetical protein O1611_g8261 [Lasiodiplodia mahajangana]|uniref:Uncharacterized protein n=1 Tax=Lasiodiplodia mahajangana TaxID=1108764 RepID=A0ACC2JDS9_9PEZI|nr:hypothetical protein O1611_g8261 [Lasiodiplodia mahajangana]
MSDSKQSTKSRICCLKPRAIVFDTTFGCSTIQNEKKVMENSEDYWPFELGPRKCRADTWDIYLNPEEDAAIAVESNKSPGNGTYLASLRLGHGFKVRFLRKAGALSSGYVIRPMGPE